MILRRSGLSPAMEARPVFHQTDEAIRGHVFCSFLALVVLKELTSRFQRAGYNFEWRDVKQDLAALQETLIKEQGKKIAVRSQCLGTWGRFFSPWE